MKRILAMLLTLALMVSSMLVLASCGDNGDGEPTESTYTVVVKDQNGDPVSGVMVKMNGKFKSTGADGKITFTAESVDYKVSVFEVPAGYDKPEGEFSFVDKVATITLNNQNAVSKVTYTIYVQTADGTPVAGARVQMCDDANCTPIMAVTDAEGKVTTQMSDGEYQAKLLSAPAGYASNDTYFDFNSDRVATIIIEAQ
jgi:hypothetical protein